MKKKKSYGDDYIPASDDADVSTMPEEEELKEDEDIDEEEELDEDGEEEELE